MSCRSYLIYLSVGKKRQFAFNFYIFLLTLTCMFTSFCAVNVFAGTPGADNYDSHTFKYFIIRTFKIEASKYIESTASHNLSHKNFQTLFRELVRHDYLSREEASELNKLIPSSNGNKSKKKKKRNKSKPTQPGNLEKTLRLLMETGAYNGKLSGIMSAMLESPSIKTIAERIQSEYETREQTDETDGQAVPLLTTPLEDSGIIKTLEQEASNFFEQLPGDIGKTVSWPKMALALSAKASHVQLFDLLRYHTDRERLTYLQTEILTEPIKLSAFLQLVAMYHGEGNKKAAQAEKLIAPVLDAHCTLSMERLIEDINHRYQRPPLITHFFREGLANFFENNKGQFRNTALNYPETFQQALNIHAPGMEAVFPDLIDAIRLQAKQPADRQATYLKLIKLISEEQEEASNDSSIKTLTEAPVKNRTPSSTGVDATLPFYIQPELNEAIARTLGTYGTPEQQLGMLIMTGGRIHPYPDGTPAYLTASSDNEYEVTFSEGDLQILASYSELQEDWRDIARSLFELEQKGRSPTDIAEEIEAIVNMVKKITRSTGDGPDNEPYRCLYNALYSAQRQMTHYPNEFAEKLYKVINQERYKGIAKLFYHEW